MSAKSIITIIILIIVAAIACLYFTGILDLKKLFTPVSVVSKVIRNGELKKTDGRTNILVLGIDRRSAGSPVNTYLTDTIMVVSLDSKNNKAAMVSIPRDLWINNYGKINSIYSVALSNAKRNAQEGQTDEEIRDAAISKVKDEIQHVVGLPIHYYAIVGFDVFKDSIDSIGGITIDVENAFEDFEYPIEGMENAEPESARYEHLSFSAGPQTMDGNRALKYARSRHSTNPKEAGDFNRARRQQAVLLAVKDKIMSSETLLDPNKMVSLYGSFMDHIQTDMDAADFLLFFKEYKDLKFSSDSIAKIVLSNDPNADSLGAGTLVAPSTETREQLYHGAYVLVPTAGTYEEIQSIVREALFK
jgi:LCP family protein required for cell wall assembly